MEKSDLFKLNERVQHLTFGKGTIIETESNVTLLYSLRLVSFKHPEDGSTYIEYVHSRDLYPDNVDISKLVELKNELFFTPTLIGKRVAVFNRASNNNLRVGEIIDETLTDFELRYKWGDVSLDQRFSKKDYAILDANEL